MTLLQEITMLSDAYFAGKLTAEQYYACVESVIATYNHLGSMS